MKRSEAIKKITKILKTWESCELNNKTSDEILSMLEYLGMLPPFNSELYAKTWRDSLTGGHVWDEE
jgi:hypothetical protein